jgi:transmembrane sensor
MRIRARQTVFRMKDEKMWTEQGMEEAIGWHMRLSAACVPTEDWAAFTDWLEADPANAHAYDAVALADADLSDSLRAAALPAHNDNEPVPARWYQRRGLLAVAASAVLALLASPFLLPGRSLQNYETRPGETRVIALADGSEIAMNGGTRLSLDAKASRFARVESGEALFTIRHDAANPFVVETADSTLRDLGTIFNVRQDDDGLDVAVAAGAVQYNPSDEAVTINAGNHLTVSHERPVPQLAAVEPGTVAGWRSGRLSYQSSSLRAIAADLERSLGARVKVSHELDDRRFSGVIFIDRDQKRFFRRLESLLGVRARPTAQGWQLTS